MYVRSEVPLLMQFHPMLSFVKLAITHVLLVLKHKYLRGRVNFQSHIESLRLFQYDEVVALGNQFLLVEYYFWFVFPLTVDVSFQKVLLSGLYFTEKVLLK